MPAGLDGRVLSAVVSAEAKAPEGRLGAQRAARLVKLWTGVVGRVPAGVEGLVTGIDFLLILIAVSCMISKSAFHCGTGNRCFADIARILARIRGFEARADSIAVLNCLVK